MSGPDIWAVVPMKRTDLSKQRLSSALSPTVRRELAIAMFGDVFAALKAVPGLAGVAVVTIDPVIAGLAQAGGARVITEWAEDGHTAAVMCAARTLAAQGRGGMLALPGDIPLVTPAEIETVLAAPCFGIVPSHDRLGSNAVLLAPPGVLELRFGDDSFRPHIARAAAAGLPVHVHELPGIALDIDTPADLHAFLLEGRPTLARRVLQQAENLGAT